MSDGEKYFLLGLIVTVYLWWHSMGKSSYAQRAGLALGTGARARGVSTTPNSFSSDALTNPRTRRQLPPISDPKAGSGRGFRQAPTISISSLNGGGGALGSGSAHRRNRGKLSRSWNGLGSAGISPQVPTSQVTSTRTIRIANGQVQVPSYTAVPTVTMGPGGGGSILNLGGQ